jgi:hypothetical protein
MTANHAKFCAVVLAAAFVGIPMWGALVTARAQKVDSQSDLQLNAISLYRTWTKMNPGLIIVAGSEAAVYG